MVGSGLQGLIDGSRLSLPQIGVYTKNGTNLEMAGVQPDFPVEARPDQLIKGIDAQIAKAVEVLGAEVVAKRAAADTVGQQVNDAALPTPTPSTKGVMKH